MSAASQDSTKVAQDYYDSSSADRFYFRIWGGEDIHVGLYEQSQDSVIVASRRTVERMASMVSGALREGATVLDLGAGYGGSARYLARHYGCAVTCLNLSETQNQRNRERNREVGLSERIRVVHGSFESVPEEDASFDLVWSQDALLHSGKRGKVIQEARRVLRAGGQFIFTDPMQSDECPSEVLQPVLNRIHLSSLGSVSFYREAARSVGFAEVAWIDLSDHLAEHYRKVQATLRQHHDEMVALSGEDYVRRMDQGLSHWIEAGRSGYLRWGIMQLQTF